MRAVAVVGVLIAVVACGSTSLQRTTAASGDVPWKPLPMTSPSPPPSPSPPAVPPGTRTCLARDLAATDGGKNGAGGRISDVISLTNVSASPCVLSGVPRAVLLDGAGGEIAMQSVSDGAYGMQPAYLKPNAGNAVLEVSWPSRDDLGCSTKSTAVTGVEIAFPDSSLKVAFEQVPATYPCAGPLGVSPYQLPLEVGQMPAPAPPGLAVRLSTPPAIKPGAVLDYAVTLTNVGTSTIDLRAGCPNYEEDLIAPGGFTPPLGGKHFYALNCDDAGLIAPGASKTFAMRLPVPADAPHGVYNLFWRLVPDMTPGAQAPVQVG